MKELQKFLDYKFEMPNMFSAAIPDFGPGEILFIF
jgi:hypothetical protein